MASDFNKGLLIISSDAFTIRFSSSEIFAYMAFKTDTFCFSIVYFDLQKSSAVRIIFSPFTFSPTNKIPLESLVVSL